MYKFSFLLILIVFSGCCKSRAKKGIDIYVKDNSSGAVIGNIQVFIHDDENSTAQAILVDIGTTDSNGKVHLKLSEKCSHHLKIESGSDNNYLSGEYQSNKNTTRGLPKSITISVQHR